MPDEMARNRMLAVILAILVIAALRASYSVTMPLAVAAVIVAAIWPVKPWLDRVLPSSLSYAGTVLLLLIAFGLHRRRLLLRGAGRHSVRAQPGPLRTALRSRVGLGRSVGL